MYVFSLYFNYSEATNFLTGSGNIVDCGESNVPNTNDVPTLSVSTAQSESIIEIEAKESSEFNF